MILCIQSSANAIKQRHTVTQLILPQERETGMLNQVFGVAPEPLPGRIQFAPLAAPHSYSPRGHVSEFLRITHVVNPSDPAKSPNPLIQNANSCRDFAGYFPHLAHNCLMITIHSWSMSSDLLPVFAKDRGPKPLPPFLRGFRS